MQRGRAVTSAVRARARARALWLIGKIFPPSFGDHFRKCRELLRDAAGMMTLGRSMELIWRFRLILAIRSS